MGSAALKCIMEPKDIIFNIFSRYLPQSALMSDDGNNLISAPMSADGGQYQVALGADLRPQLGLWGLFREHFGHLWPFMHVFQVNFEVL